MTRRAALALWVSLSLLVPAVALADRMPQAAELQAQGAGAEVEATSVGRAGGYAGPRARARIAPDPGLDLPTFRAAVQRTAPALEQCLVAAGLTGTMRVTARVELSHAMAFDIVAPRRDPGATQCAELELRRALTQIAAQVITHPVHTTITVRHRAVRAPRVPHPPPPAHGDLAAFEAPVHAAMENDRFAMLQCLSAAAPGVVGQASLRLTLAPDGSLALASASLPTGVPAGPALPCLSARVSQLRFSPAPPRAMTITHTFPLGL
jgi:hypothetical protein